MQATGVDVTVFYFVTFQQQIRIKHQIVFIVQHIIIFYIVHSAVCLYKTAELPDIAKCFTHYLDAIILLNSY